MFFTCRYAAAIAAACGTVIGLHRESSADPAPKAEQAESSTTARPDTTNHLLFPVVAGGGLMYYGVRHQHALCGIAKLHDSTPLKIPTSDACQALCAFAKNFSGRTVHRVKMIGGPPTRGPGPRFVLTPAVFVSRH